MNMETVIIGIYIAEPRNSGPQVQELLTAFGCSIRTRIGLNSYDEDLNRGVILLELTGDKKERKNLMDSLRKLSGIEVKKMEFGKN